jgi:hypothetical protein
VAAVTAFFVAAATVALLQFLRLKDRRLLALCALFALHGAGRVLGEATLGGMVADLLAGCAGLTLLYWLLPHQTHPPLP